MELTKVQVEELAHVFYMTKVFGGVTAALLESEALKALLTKGLIQFRGTNAAEVLPTPEGIKLILEDLTQETLDYAIDILGWIDVSSAAGPIVRQLLYNLSFEHFPRYLTHEDRRFREQAMEVYSFRRLAKALKEVKEEEEARAMLQVTDKQLSALLKIGLVAAPLDKQTSISDWWVTRDELKKMGLVEHTHAGFLSLTERGEQELRRNIVDALTLTGELQVPLGDIYSYIEPLSIEELTELLVHPNGVIRRFATLRVEELRGETERVRSQLGQAK